MGSRLRRWEINALNWSLALNWSCSRSISIPPASADAVTGNGQSHVLRRSDGLRQGIQAVADRLFRRLAVGNTLGEIKKRNQITAAFFVGERADFERMKRQISHGFTAGTTDASQIGGVQSASTW
jgi:hypothetical protein